MSDEPQQQGWTPRDATAAGPPEPDKRPGRKTGPDDTDRATGKDGAPEADETRADDESPAADTARADDESPAAEDATPAGEEPYGDEESAEPAPSTHKAHAGALPAATVKAGMKHRASRPRRTGRRRAVPTWRVTLGALLFASLLLIGGLVTGYLLVDIPPANAAATAQTNVYLYADGTHIARDGDVNRENVSLEEIPMPVRRAVLAAEDRDFYGAPAIDPTAMVRAAWNTVTGKGKQSGSTITQQYVKNYYLGQEQTVTRKVKEFFIAIKLGRNQSKSEILEGYLNTSYFGRNAYGIQAAAHAYYGKDVQDLDVSQGAYLASLLNAPNAYDVGTYPQNKQAAHARWTYVLGGMVKEKWLSSEDRADLTFPMPQRPKPVSGLSGQGGYIVQAVKEYLAARGILDEKTLATGGHRITTTLQRAKQDALSAAVDEQVTSELDSEREADRNVRVGGVSVEPSTGKVVAMYGGIDYTKQFVNNATRHDYQVGSTFKPFVIAAAMEHRSTTQDGHPINPNTVYVGDSERPVQGWTGARYAPENEDDVSYGPIPVRRAADESVNAVFAQMAVDVGPGRVMDTAIALGIPRTTPDLSPSPSIALGPATASVLDMAGAYATLANHGRHTDYTLVEDISKNGTEVPLPEPDSEQAVSREAADTTTAVLRGVVDGGTGSAAQSAGRPAAGKTGTAEEDRAAWFAGYTPELATVVAVMGQNPATGVQTPLYGALGMPRMNGGGAPAEIWGQYTAAALSGTPVQDFDLRLAPGSTEPPPGQRNSEHPESGSPEDYYRPRDPGEQAGTGRDGAGTGETDRRPGTGEEPGTGTGTEGPSGQHPRTPNGAGSPAAPAPAAPAMPAMPAPAAPAIRSADPTALPQRALDGPAEPDDLVAFGGP